MLQRVADSHTLSIPGRRQKEHPAKGGQDVQTRPKVLRTDSWFLWTLLPVALSIHLLCSEALSCQHLKERNAANRHEEESSENCELFASTAGYVRAFAARAFKYVFS